MVTGAELTGDVLEVGEGVKNVKVGDRVFGLSGQKLGGFAEEIVLPSMVRFLQLSFFIFHLLLTLW